MSSAAGWVEVVVRGRVVAEWPATSTLGVLVAPPPPNVRGVAVELVTPLQLDHQGSRPDGLALVQAALRRLRGVQRHLGQSGGPRWELPSTLECDGGTLVWAPGARESRHQGQRVELSGWVGRLELGPQVAPVAELLAAGEVLQVGRHTSEGLGRYRLRWR